MITFFPFHLFNIPFNPTLQVVPSLLEPTRRFLVNGRVETMKGGFTKWQAHKTKKCFLQSYSTQPSIPEGFVEVSDTVLLITRYTHVSRIHRNLSCRNTTWHLKPPNGTRTLALMTRNRNSRLFLIPWTLFLCIDLNGKYNANIGLTVNKTTSKGLVGSRYWQNLA